MKNLVADLPFCVHISCDYLFEVDKYFPSLDDALSFVKHESLRLDSISEIYIFKTGG